MPAYVDGVRGPDGKPRDEAYASSVDGNAVCATCNSDVYHDCYAGERLTRHDGEVGQ